MKFIKALLSKVFRYQKVDDKKLEALVDNVQLAQVMHQPVEDREELEDVTDQYQSIISFIVGKGGNIDLNISWNDDEQITAKNLASVLYLLNNGTFETSCANLLLGIAKSEPDSMTFVRSVIEEWNNQKAKDSLIKPSEVFQFGMIDNQ